MDHGCNTSRKGKERKGKERVMGEKRKLTEVEMVVLYAKRLLNHSTEGNKLLLRSAIKQYQRTLENPPQVLRFHVRWPSELAAGIRAGSEDITITFTSGWAGGIPADVVQDFREYLREEYDGAEVLTQNEYDQECKLIEAAEAESMREFYRDCRD